MSILPTSLSYVSNSPKDPRAIIKKRSISLRDPLQAPSAIFEGTLTEALRS